MSATADGFWGRATAWEGALASLAALPGRVLLLERRGPGGRPGKAPATVELLRRGVWEPETVAALEALTAAPSSPPVQGPEGLVTMVRRVGEDVLVAAVEEEGPESVLRTLSAAFEARCWQGRIEARSRDESARYRNISLLYELSRRLDPQQAVDVLARTVLANLAALVPYDVAGLLLADGECLSLVVQPRRRLDGAFLASFRDAVVAEFEGYAFGTALDGRVEESILDPLEPEPSGAGAVAIRSRLSVPVILRGGVFAGHLLLVSFEGEIADSTHFQLLSTIVNHVNAVLTIRRLLAELERQARTDEMTGVANYRTFRAVLSRETGRARRYGTTLSLLMLDIDHFKAVNDTFGHQEGDRVLKGVARILDAGRRELDTVARYGGEEFAVILPETDAPGAVNVAERLRRRIHESGLLGSRPVTVSVGAATFTGGSAGDDELIGAADGALYDAKGGGRDRVVSAGVVGVSREGGGSC